MKVFKKLYMRVAILTLIMLPSLALIGCGKTKDVVEETKKEYDKEITTAVDMEYIIKLKQWNEYSRDWEQLERIGVYSGQLVNGVPDGEGSFSVYNSTGVYWTYTGMFSKGTISGYGKTEWYDGFCEEGTYTDGAFTPVADELFCAVGTRSEAPFTITENNRNFIRENINIFQGEINTDYDDLINYDLTASMIKDEIKNAEKSLYYCMAQVCKIYANSMYGHNITLVLARDYEENLYLLVCDGELEYIEEQCNITFTGLPVSNSYFRNSMDETCDVIVIIVSDVF